MKKLFLFLSVMIGCAHVSERAANIQVHNQMSMLLEKCQKLGPVVGIGSHFGLDMREDDNSAMIDLREKAATSNADSVVMLNHDVINGHVHIQGILFNCYGQNKTEGLGPPVLKSNIER